MSWWISVQLLAARFSHHSPTRSPSPPSRARAKLFISSWYDPTCLSTFCRNGVFLIFGCGPSGMVLRHAAGLSALHVEGKVGCFLSLSLSAADPLHIAPRGPHAADTFSYPHDWFCLACGIIFPMLKRGQLEGTVLLCVRTMAHPPSYAGMLTCTSLRSSVPGGSGAWMLIRVW